MKNVLVAGASGLVGTELSKRLTEKGYTVYSLSHSKPTDKNQKRFHWNPEVGFIEEDCLAGIDHVINLAGVGVYDHKWSKRYKEQILHSRINSTRLLSEAIAATDHVKTFINASAIGFYGSNTKEVWVNEDTTNAHDFLAEVVKAWESEFFNSGIITVRQVALRLGIVLSPKGGALPQLMKPIQYFAGAPIGTGGQYISWIHIDDLCSLFIWTLEKESMQGIYNAVAPNPVTNKELTETLATYLKRTLWLPNIPAFVLKLILGAKKAETLIGGNRVSNEKVSSTGFVFKYKTLVEALHSFSRTDLIA